MIQRCSWSRIHLLFTKPPLCPFIKSILIMPLVCVQIILWLHWCSPSSNVNNKLWLRGSYLWELILEIIFNVWTDWQLKARRALTPILFTLSLRFLSFSRWDVLLVMFEYKGKMGDRKRKEVYRKWFLLRIIHNVWTDWPFRARRALTCILLNCDYAFLPLSRRDVPLVMFEFIGEMG